jgi:hypothetical protein
MITGPTGGDFESEAPTRGWEAVPALAASVPRPAVSELRPPRESRRTPLEGVPTTTEASVLSAILSGEARGAQVAMPPPAGAPSGRPLFAPPDPEPPPAPGFANPYPGYPPGFAPPAPGFPQPPYPGQGYPPGGPAQGLPLSYPVMAQPPYPYGGPPPSGGPFPGGPGSFTGQMQALELDEIPDAYKIRRGRTLRPVHIALIALALAAIAGLTLYGIYGGGEEPAATAVIEIVSSPAGATVTIDGAAHPEPTPTRFVGEAGRKYLIALDLPRYQRWQRETSGGDEKVIARLDAVTVRLKVGSTPPDAEVLLNGASAGRTPIELGGLDPLTTKVIEVRHRCCKPVRQVLEWGDRELEKTLDFPLER